MDENLINSDSKETQNSSQPKRGKISQIFGGVLLLLLGIILLFRATVPIEIVQYIFDIIWPAILITAGFTMLIRSKRVIIGGIVLILGIINLLTNLKIIDLNLPSIILGILLIYIGIVLIVKFMKPRKQNELTDIFWSIVQDD